jgi:hypothetical protein
MRLDIGQSGLRAAATVEASAARPELAAALHSGLFDKQITFDALLSQLRALV